VYYFSLEREREERQITLPVPRFEILGHLNFAYMEIDTSVTKLSEKFLFREFSKYQLVVGNNGIPGKYPDFVPLHVPPCLSTELYVEASTAFYVDFLQYITYRFL